MMSRNSRTARCLPVTVAIPVKNEEANLEACLRRLGRFSDVVVIDSGSTDRTVDIAKACGARVLDFRWDGRYPKKRNWFLLSSAPKQPWILFLDADEFVDDSFCDAVEKAILRDDVDGYWLNYKIFFLEKWLRHGVPQRKLALLRVGNIFYERVEEREWSKLDMEIHEHPIVHGRVGEITTAIEHRDNNRMSRFLEKHLEYAQWEARRFLSISRDDLAKNTFTSRQRFKYINLDKWWYSHFYFCYAFVVKLGFLDGGAGYHYAAYKAWYFRTIRLLIREKLTKGEWPS